MRPIAVQDAVPKPGMVLSGRYRLEEDIARGGSSLVFRATELKLGREVALKLLGTSTLDAAGLDRFRREADLARQLQHPNTVRMLDFDFEAEPMPFIVYELLSGHNLAQVLKADGALPEPRVVRLVTQILKSLMESHAVGVVHRDIKPGNIFVCTYAGEPDFVKVLDFGIAKALGPEALQLTADGMLVGTPRYMPPDQINGLPAKPGMDLYALGLLMAEMLEGSAVIRGSGGAACMAQLSPDPIALPPAALASRLRPVIVKAVDKDPERRYQLASAMLEDIDRAMQAAPSDANMLLPLGEAVAEAGKSMTAAPDSWNNPTLDAPLVAPPPRPLPPATRAGTNPWLLLLAVVVVLVALALLGVVGTWLVASPSSSAP